MSETDSPTLPDRIEGAPHPAETQKLFGQAAAEHAFLDAVNSGRLHHGWLLTGPRGVGKATLAWRAARYLLANAQSSDEGLFADVGAGAASLDIPEDHPVARRARAGSEPGLFVLRRGQDEKTKRLKTVITVDEARRLKNFFALSSADGGPRVVIVDSADELNVSAANALLKLLEEPPRNTTLLLVSHQPSRLLPTIRSRCRELRLSTLSHADMTAALSQAGILVDSDVEALAELSAGSVGEAVRLNVLDGLALYRELVALIGSLPRLDRQRAVALAEAVAGRGAEARLELLLNLIDVALNRLARTGATGQPPRFEAAPGEADAFARLCPTPAQARDWASVAQEVGIRLRHGRAVNLDPAALILDTVFKLRKTAATNATGAA